MVANNSISLQDYESAPLKEERFSDSDTRPLSPSLLPSQNPAIITESRTRTGDETSGGTTQGSLDSFRSGKDEQRHPPHMSPPSAPGYSCIAPSPTMEAVDTSGAVPVPVRSASWAAGSPEPPPRPSFSVSAISTDGPDQLPAATAERFDVAETSLTGNTPQDTQSKSSTKCLAAPTKKHAVKKSDKTAGKSGGTVNARRQKRLARNRESARLSRRRRKHYLEVLEDRVTQLSLEMDQSRREHAAAAIETVLAKRKEILQSFVQSADLSHSLPVLDTALSRTSQQLSVVSTFQKQQLRSFALPAHSKFVLWLTLQGDVFFRGGRAASERLSAARIGERMLQNGNDRVTPLNSMWPLFCHEVALSYEQEERVRSFQRNLLQEPPNWLERHTARASSLVMQSFHDSVNALGLCLHKREQKTASVLTSTQRLAFMAWAESNLERISKKFDLKRQQVVKNLESREVTVSRSQHVAANLYILNSRLQKILTQLPHRVDLVPPTHLKRFLRRPSFESLGQQREDNGALTREGSFASSGSLKRSVSSLSVVSENGEDKPPQQIVPEECELAAASLVDKELGFVKDLIPPIIQPVLPPAPSPVVLPTASQSYTSPASYASPQPVIQPQSTTFSTFSGAAQLQNNSTQFVTIGAPALVVSHPPGVHSTASHVAAAPPAPVALPSRYHEYYGDPGPSSLHSSQSQPIYPQVPGPPPQQAGYNVAVQQRQPPQHNRVSSFLPSDLNFVPEMFSTSDGTEDFLMTLIDDGDWAIGEGVDMDTAA